MLHSSSGKPVHGDGDGEGPKEKEGHGTCVAARFTTGNGNYEFSRGQFATAALSCRVMPPAHDAPVRPAQTLDILVDSYEIYRTIQ